jgi:endonuclease/exonuclease/phosphatase family metal-dependent hydrolase
MDAVVNRASPVLLAVLSFDCPLLIPVSTGALNQRGGNMTTPLMVMTWNVENLFPVGWKVSPQRRVTQAEFDAKLDFLARQIDTLQPDILALQEVGGTDFDATATLTTLEARLSHRYAQRVISGFPDSRKIRVAFLVADRVTVLPEASPPEIVTFADGELQSVADWHGELSTRLGRGALPIVVRFGNHTIRLLTLHLKSKLISYRSDSPGFPRFAPHDENERAIGAGLGLLRRAAEATTIRIRLNDLMRAGDAMHTIVLGDFNDEPHAATSLMFLGAEDRDATRAEPSLDHTRLYNLVDSIPRSGGEDNNLRFLPPKDKADERKPEQYSRDYNGRGDLIDHILVSRSLLGPGSDLKQGNSVVKEVRSRVDLIKGQMVTDNPNERLGKEAPDHAPVYARFELDD